VPLQAKKATASESGRYNGNNNGNDGGDDGDRGTGKSACATVSVGTLFVEAQLDLFWKRPTNDRISP
jgi:hypothetical protein